MEQEVPGGRERSTSMRRALTARELQVRELVERGMKNKEIAMTLGIRTGTVKIHLRRIFEKTGIHGRYDLALAGLTEKGVLAQPVLEPM
jgi:DNA-binding NarL/FixJ family response regulator